VDHPFQCPSCKSKTGFVRLKIEPKSYEDLIGATCTNCMHTIGKEDIKRGATAFVDALLKKFKLKR